MKSILVPATELGLLAAILVTGPLLSFPTFASETALREEDSALGRLDFRQVIREAKEEVFPAVVYIKCIKETYEPGTKRREEVAGSGVIISPQGELLTNWHIVDKAVGARCLLSDGRSFDAQIVGSDKDTDLALVQLALPEGGQALPFAELGDSARLKEGDFVMAMGAPWGLSRSVSIGIISCPNRYLPERSEYSLWLQTDASISPGNSGGPLVNTQGEVVGITTLSAIIGGDMGFAVPAETVRHVVAQLREYGKMNWSWTGLHLQPLKDFDRNIYFDVDEGVVVAGTDPDSPAQRAGVLPRDRILRVNGTPVRALSPEDLPALRMQLGLLPKLQAAQFLLVREGTEMTCDIVPCEKGKVEGEELDCPRWDFTVKTINRFDNPQLYFYRKQGVFIFSVKRPGNAQNARLTPQDIILKIDDHEVTTLEEVKALHKAALENATAKHDVLFVILRDGLMHQVVLDFSRDYEKE
jgi:serine protease Do